MTTEGKSGASALVEAGGKGEGGLSEGGGGASIIVDMVCVMVQLESGDAFVEVKERGENSKEKRGKKLKNKKTIVEIACD
jgi:hypothetical protein